MIIRSVPMELDCQNRLQIKIALSRDFGNSKSNPRGLPLANHQIDTVTNCWGQYPLSRLPRRVFQWDLQRPSCGIYTMFLFPQIFVAIPVKMKSAPQKNIFHDWLHQM